MKTEYLCMLDDLAKLEPQEQVESWPSHEELDEMFACLNRGHEHRICQLVQAEKGRAA